MLRLFFFSAVRALVPPPASPQPCVDILLAYHPDARRAASGVWYFGTRSVSCAAGTAGLGSLRSAWDSRRCGRADTRSSLLGSPGRRWRVWGKWSHNRATAQNVCNAFGSKKKENSAHERLLKKEAGVQMCKNWSFCLKHEGCIPVDVKSRQPTLHPALRWG